MTTILLPWETCENVKWYTCKEASYFYRSGWEDPAYWDVLHLGNFDKKRLIKCTIYICCGRDPSVYLIQAVWKQEMLTSRSFGCILICICSPRYDRFISCDVERYAWISVRATAGPAETILWIFFKSFTSFLNSLREKNPNANVKILMEKWLINDLKIELNHFWS